MTPHVAPRGHSFVGAGQYYLHDKGEQSSERVLFTRTFNLATNDAEKAMRYMAHTAMTAQQRKRRAGVRIGGQEANAGAVYAFSLSWHPEQQPTEAEMEKAGLTAIAKLGFTEHEAVIVGHGDTKHPHIHIIVNLVHPMDGRTGDTYQDQRKLSAWALAYERADGTIYCKEREQNALKHERGEATLYQGAGSKEIAQRVALFYEHSSSAEEFSALLRDEGLTLTQGDKGRMLLVGEDGSMMNLTRQLPKGINKKQVLAKFDDLNISALPFVHDVVREKQDTDDSDATEIKPGEDISQERHPTASDAPDTPLKAQSPPDHDIHAAMRQQQRERAFKALHTQRTHQTQRALRRAARIERVLASYQPKQVPFGARMVTIPPEPYVQRAFAVLERMRSRLMQQPVGMMQRMGKTVQRYTQHVASIWKQGLAQYVPLVRAKHDMQEHTSKAEAMHYTREYEIHSDNYDLERSVGCERDDEYGMDL